MTSRIIKFDFLFILSAIIIAAVAAYAQPVYQEKESETIITSSADGNQSVTVVLPRRSIQPAEVAVIVNSQDPQSVNVAAYYQQARNIPVENLVLVSFPPGSTSMNEQDFSLLKAQVDAAAAALPDIQALVITWTEPWKVTGLNTGKGMSITSALTFGFHPDYYNETTEVCAPTRKTPYFNSASVHPYSDHGFRPAMMLAGISETNVYELIDRAVQADRTFPRGNGYFFRTTNDRRSDPRYRAFINTVDTWSRPDGLALHYIDNSAGDPSGNYLSDTPDVLFYFTGLATVPDIDTNGFAAGAVADHLTSAGGRLTGANPQMSILRWLEAGAIASYGTVIEPCNYADKFPHTTTFVSSYFGGATVLEAYWKSVRTPGEGIFVGDPLTRPYGTRVTLTADGGMEILTTILQPGKTYTLLEGGTVEGPFKIVQENLSVDTPGFATIIQNVGNSVYVMAEEARKNFPAAVTNDGNLQESPRISGSGIAWLDYRNAFFQKDTEADIYFYDLKTGQERQIGSVPSAARAEFDISNRHIAWAGMHPDDQYQYAIFLYDIETGHTGIIGPAVLIFPTELQISDNYLVWLEAGAISVYDLNTNQFRTIPTTAVSPIDLDLSANRLVVEDISGAVFVYDLAANLERKILPDTSPIPSSTRISGDWVVWKQPGPEDPPGKGDIYLYNLTTGETQRITFGTVAQRSTPAIAGNWIAWTDDRLGPDNSALYAYDILTGEEHSIETMATGRIIGTPSIAASRLVWVGAVEHPADIASNKSDIFMYELPRFGLRAGRTAEAVTDAWYFIDLPFDFIKPPVLLAGIETYTEGDTAGLRIRHFSNGGLEVKIEEEASADVDRSHAAEAVGYITAETGPIYDAFGNIIGEAGFVTTNQRDGQWHLLDLNYSYVDPVVFMNIITMNGYQPAHVRLRNVAAGSFEYRMEEWEYLDQVHVTETLAYLVVETGFHQLPDGRLMEVSTVDTDHGWKAATFGPDFRSVPVTLSQCQTYNGPQAVITRLANLNAAGFQVRLQEAEGNGAGAHVIETIGYIAVEADQLQ